MRIAVYCSAKNSIPEEYKQMGDQLGTWIGQGRNTLVYGGATGGLMSRVSDAAQKAGGRIIGVLPKTIARWRTADNCDELIEVNDMAERKRTMREIAECFVCLPGSYGTLDEMFDVIASGTVGEHKKPIYILNHRGFYDNLKKEIEHIRALHFLPEEEVYTPTFVDTLNELFTQLKTIEL